MTWSDVWLTCGLICSRASLTMQLHLYADALTSSNSVSCYIWRSKADAWRQLPLPQRRTARLMQPCHQGRNVTTWRPGGGKYSEVPPPKKNYTYIGHTIKQPNDNLCYYTLSENDSDLTKYLRTGRYIIGFRLQQKLMILNDHERQFTALSSELCVFWLNGRGCVESRSTVWAPRSRDPIRIY